VSTFEPRILARDRQTGKLVLFHTLPDGRYVVETQVDVQDIVDTCTTMRNDAPAGWKGEMHYVAKLPLHLWQSLRTEGRVQEVKDFKKWLNDGDNAAWRTKRGRL